MIMEPRHVASFIKRINWAIIALLIGLAFSRTTEPHELVAIIVLYIGMYERMGQE